jgi:hypothetical protein
VVSVGEVSAEYGALTEAERESLTGVVKTWLPVSYAGLIPRLEQWIAARGHQAVRAEWRLREYLPAWTEPVATLDRDELNHRYVEMKTALERIFPPESTGGLR